MTRAVLVSLAVAVSGAALPPGRAVQSGSIAVQRIDAATLWRDLEVLAADDMEGRKPGTAGHDRARQYIVRRFREAGLRPIEASYEQPFTYSSRRDPAGTERRGTNVVGMVRGRGQPDLALIITAHYDHLGVQNGQIFNGADDNASGAAALFALAASFVAQPPRHTLVFAALDAEETGLFGARALLERPALGRYRIVINVNLDMVGRDPNNTLFVAGLAHYPFLKPYVDRIAADAPIKLVPGHDGRGSAATEDWTRESDHYVFHQRGIPFLYFGVEDDANHHRPTDKVAAISRRFYVGAVETVAAALRVLDANAAAIAAQPRKVGAPGRGSNQVPGSARSRTPDPDRGTLILGLRTLGPWTPLDLLEDS